MTVVSLNENYFHPHFYLKFEIIPIKMIDSLIRCLFMKLSHFDTLPRIIFHHFIGLHSQSVIFMTYRSQLIILRSNVNFDSIPFFIVFRIIILFDIFFIFILFILAHSILESIIVDLIFYLPHLFYY